MATGEIGGSAKAWYREPLIHFLVLGAALFLINSLWDKLSPSQENIVVNEARIKALAENFRRTWQRAPTATELDGLVEEHIRDEVMTREAFRLGLDRDDTVIRRRLRQKLEIITEEAAAAIPPTDTQLQAFLDQHAAVFRGESRIAFAQVFLDPSKRHERIDADAKALLTRLNDPSRRPLATDFSSLGDRLFVLKAQYGLAGQREIAATFGAEFATTLPTLPTGLWSGPVESGYGLHLVRVDQVVPPPVPTLADVRQLVEREWRNDQRKEGSQAYYQKLRSGYQIVIKRGAAAGSAP